MEAEAKTMATANTLGSPASIRAMRVLVTYASKHGSTQEVAERIASSLNQHGVQAEVRPMNRVDELDGYDGVLIGSAIYIGRWMKEATQFVERVRPALANCRVWSSAQDRSANSRGSIRRTSQSSRHR
jgi:menaquinone-dependent protoporphyrinogen IX oxidase